MHFNVCKSRQPAGHQFNFDIRRQDVRNEDQWRSAGSTTLNSSSIEARMRAVSWKNCPAAPSRAPASAGGSTCSSACWINLSTTVGIPSSRCPPPPGFGMPTRLTGSGRKLPSSTVARMSGHALLQIFARVLHRASIDTGTSLVGLDALPRSGHALSGQCLPEQVIGPAVRLCMPRQRCFIAHGFRHGFTAPRPRAPQSALRLPELLMHCTAKRPSCLVTVLLVGHSSGCPDYYGLC